MNGLVISYQMNPSSGNVIVDRVLDIRPVSWNEDGSYQLPRRLRIQYPQKSPEGVVPAPLNGIPDSIHKKYFVRQIGIGVDKGETFVYIQPPHGVYLPNSGYSAFKVAPIDNRFLKTLNVYTGDGIEEDAIEKLRHARSGFSVALAAVFEKANMTDRDAMLAHA